MASATPTEMSMECPICVEVFTTPKRLPCGHTFCLGCLESLAGDKRPGQTLTCPLCRQQFAIPDGGLRDLPMDFMAEASLAKTRVSWMAGRGSRWSSSEETTWCTEHPERLSTVYCCDCQQATCETCFIRQHNGHKHADVNDIGETLREQLITNSDNIGRVETTLDERLVKLDICRTKVLADVTTVEKQIAEELELVKEAIEHEADELRRQLHDVRTAEMDRIEAAKAQVERPLNEVREFVRKCQEMKRSSTAGQLVASYKQLSTTADRLSRLATDAWSFCPVEIRFVQSNYRRLLPTDLSHLIGQLIVEAPGQHADSDTENNSTISSWEELNKDLNHTIEKLEQKSRTANELGAKLKETQQRAADLYKQLKIVTKTCDRLRLKPERLSCIKAHKLSSLLHISDKVRGLTLLNSQLYVLLFAHKSTDIAVYDSTTFCPQRRLALDGLRDVSDMTSCSVNQCIYVADTDRDVIHRLDAIVKGPVSGDRWLIGDKPWGLSVTSSRHNLLVACFLKQKIKEFTTSGQLVLEISLQPDVTNPWQAIELDGGGDTRQYIVAHGLGPGRRLVKVGPGGSVALSCQLHMTSSTSSSSWSMTEASTDCPIHVGVDADGFAFVLDTHKRRLCVVDPWLCLVCDIASSDDGSLSEPRRLHWDESTKRVYVANLNGRVLAFQY